MATRGIDALASRALDVVPQLQRQVLDPPRRSIALVFEAAKPTQVAACLL